MYVCIYVIFNVTNISAYAPTMTYTVEVEEAFYEDLDGAIRETPRGDQLVILGDFNAQMGSDSNIWKTWLVNMELERQTPMGFSFWRNAVNMG